MRLYLGAECITYMPSSPGITKLEYNCALLESDDRKNDDA